MILGEKNELAIAELKEIVKTSEERWFGYYLDELGYQGYIRSYEYQPDSIILCDESQHPFKHFLEKKYTYDYLVTWNDEAIGTFCSELDKKCPFYADVWNVSRIDTKGSGFSLGLNKSDVTFADRQAWIWDKHRIFIQKVEVSLKAKSIFEKTFLPQRIKEEEIYTTNGKTWTKGQSKVKFNSLTLNQYAIKQEEDHARRAEKSTRVSGRTRRGTGEDS